MITAKPTCTDLVLAKHQSVCTRDFPNNSESCVRRCKNENKAGVHKSLSPNYILFIAAPDVAFPAPAILRGASTFLGNLCTPGIR